MKSILSKLKTGVKTAVQHVFITLELFGGNGLANHAAAGAYGFLLSVAPILLLISFIVLFAFKSSPHLITTLIGNIPFLEIIFNEEWLTGEFFGFGISSIIFVLSIFWAGRILVLAMQRGLMVVFPGSKQRNPVTNTLVTLAVEAAVLVFVLALLFGSQTARYLYRLIDFFPMPSIVGNRLISYAALGLMSFFAYLLVPVNPPRKLSAFLSALLFVIAYGCTAFALENILDPAKYNFLYGALGGLVVLLVNVYFFFMLFFFGAQLAFVIDYFDALLFSKLRQARKKADKKLNIVNKLFFSVEGKLKKYFVSFKKGEVIFSQGDSGKDVYFILDGKVEVILYSSQHDDDDDPERQSNVKQSAKRGKAKHGNISRTDILEHGSFFGEMGYLLSENRTATAKAKTNISALALPPAVFEKILKYDSSLDRTIIEHMSRRLKDSNDYISSLESE